MMMQKTLKVLAIQEQELKEIKQQINNQLRDAQYKKASEKLLEFLL